MIKNKKYYVLAQASACASKGGKVTYSSKPIIYNLPFVLILFLAFTFGCNQPQETTQTSSQSILADSLAQVVRAAYAPDKRVAIFSIETKSQQDTLILKGETDQPRARHVLRHKLDSAGITYTDSIHLLPDASVGADTLGVVSISVANIRSQPKHSAELATQAIMGTPLRILKKQGEWHLVQTPDKYISWMQGSFQPMTQAEYAAWQQKNKLIFKHIYGFAYQDESLVQSVSDLVAGNVLELLGEAHKTYWVKLPDGREAYVAKEEAEPLNVWLSQAKPTEETLVSTAMEMMGIPYLWGGTSTKAADCSGFTKTIYFMNGTLLPRDASQQIHAGELVDDKKDFSHLRPGDLLFFGTAATDSTRERVTHVGMWIGNNEYIHAPGLAAHVSINSIDPASDNYDPLHVDYYLRTKRMINSKKEVIALKDVKLF